MEDTLIYFFKNEEHIRSTYCHGTYYLQNYFNVLTIPIWSGKQFSFLHFVELSHNFLL